MAESQPFLAGVRARSHSALGSRKEMQRISMASLALAHPHTTASQ